MGRCHQSEIIDRRQGQFSNESVDETNHAGCTLILPNGSRYAEGHHIQPLGAPHNGCDVLGNINWLSANHHAACDLGAIRLSLSE